MLEPNIKDGVNHILRLVCGAGTHSKDGMAVLKVKVPEWLEAQGFEINTNIYDGSVLVRFAKFD